MNPARLPSPPAPSSSWRTLLGCTALAGCTVTTPLPALEQPAALRPKAPEPAQVAQVGFGSSAQFVHCQPHACPRPTSKTLARLRPAAVQPPLPVKTPIPALPATQSALPHPPQAAASGALHLVDHVPERSARSAVVSDKSRSGPPIASQQRVTILFLPASARIGPDGHARLAAAPVQAATRLTVRGHADPTGNVASNLRLARSRAQAVVAQLRAIRPALRSDRIAVVVDGRCCGAAGHGGTASHARQRSVEIVIEGQEPDP